MSILPMAPASVLLQARDMTKTRDRKRPANDRSNTSIAAPTPHLVYRIYTGLRRANAGGTYLHERLLKLPA
jgi:hypothetical protein